MERCIRFRKRGKLGPRFIDPFGISAQVGRVAYHEDLPDELSQIHKTFHVSQLRRCVVDDSAVISLGDIQLDECMNCVEKPIAILDKNSKTLCNKVVNLVKVQCQHIMGSKWTWESEDEMREHYPGIIRDIRLQERNLIQVGADL